ncbi:hypothetical protein FZ934_07950 [Rhizobium grahamii]|uniref:D-alanyl-D-alanine carboxypeptidase-like core domain-containing protein n=1 Tax=Rhizobium grahamii TaxID=1120045 RepID=A0A5Q0C8Q4_9HYPH|nr:MULTISPECIES: D-alanyl-D-alanine carboxypeptidase family protein [Rhizobium]QFY60370.1 hypothetical protein FZ934_07950 [Rhizobium grahamii]QRM50504.1 hypothetical protein F3Y33_14940 [Rhizobium sp. BG6]
MANEEKKLVVDVMARVDKLEKGMARAAANVNKQSAVMEARTKKFAVSLESNITSAVDKVNGALGKIGLGGIAAGGVAGIVAGLASIAKGVAEIGDQAKVAGINVKAFQELKYVAEQNRIGIDSLTDGIKELNLRADEFIVTGQGSAAEAFQRLGYNSETLAKKLKDPSELFAEIIGRLKQFDKAAQIRIADEVFGGTGGEKFVQLINQGAEGIRATTKEANALGLVMDDALIRRAEEIDRRFNAISNTVGMNLKSAIVSAADSLADFIDGFRDFQNQQTKTLDNRQIELGQQRLELENKILEAQNNSTLSVRNRTRAIETYQAQLRKVAEEEAKIVDVINGRVKAAQRPTDRTWTPPVAPPGGFGSTGSGKADLSRFLAPGKDASSISGMSSSFESKLEKLFAALPVELANQIKINSGFRSNERQAQLWQQALEKYGSVSEARKWVAPPGNSQHNKGNAADLGYGSSAAKDWVHQNASRFGLSFPLSNEDWHIEDSDARSKDVADKTKDLEARGKAYDDIIAKAQQFVAEQGLEADALGMTEQAAAKLRYEQELLNAAKEAGIQLNPAQVNSLKELAANMAEAEARTRQLGKSQEEAAQKAAELANAGKEIVGGFVSDLIHGVSAADALRNALARVADTMLSSALDQLFGGGTVKAGGGLLGGLFSSIFSGIGKNANGTDNWRGGLSVVGERGPEIVNLPQGAQVIPNHKLITAPVAPSLKGSGGASTVNNASTLNVNVSGANGDDHVRMLVKQGVGEALAEQNERMRRGGFGQMQDQWSAQKG